MQMTSLHTLALVLSGAGVVVPGALGVMFLRDPAKGMAFATHRLENLPQVMADRYVALVALGLGATCYGDMKVIAFLFAVFAFLGFADAVIYARAGTPFSKHLMAGVAATVVVVVALAANFQTGAGA